MKQLSDNYLNEMLGDNNEFVPDDDNTKKQVRRELKLSALVPEPPSPAPKHSKIDLHKKTEQQAWDEINALLRSGTRTATVITGASGILKIKFQQWMTDSIISPYIISWEMVNNGSFEIRIRKNATSEF